MSNEAPNENFTEQQVTYTIEARGRFFIIEHVPAKVCTETGEQLFSPEIVERLQRTIWGRKQPNRVLETPVYEFAGRTQRPAGTPDKRKRKPRRLFSAG